MNALRIAILFCIFAIAVSAEETNTLPTTITVDRVTYENVRWSTVTPAGVSILHRTGAATIPLEKLPPELQKRFGYNPKKAADYRAAERRMEVARQKARQEQWAAVAAEKQRQAQLEADRQKQIAEAKAKDASEAAAKKQAAEAAARKEQADFFASLGPVTMIKFTYASRIQSLPDGTYSANLWYSDDQGYGHNFYCTFPGAGLNFMKNAQRGTVPNACVVYGRPYSADLVNAFGVPIADTAYWLVGIRQEMRGGNGYPAW
jgi:hypothetical protein